MAAPTVTGTSSSGKTSGPQASLTFAHTATGDPLYVALGYYRGGLDRTIAVTYGGTPLVKIGGQNSAPFNHEWWALAAPAAGAANIVITSAPSSAYITAAARNVAGADPAASRNLTSNQNSGTTASVVVTSGPDDLVLDFVTSDNNGVTFAVGAGQTQDTAQSGEATFDLKGASSREPGAASVTMSWTLSSATWMISALSSPAGSSAPASVPYVAGLMLDVVPPHNQWKATTPSDTADAPFARLWVGGAGNLAAVASDGTVVTFSGIVAGTTLPIAGRRINATNTTATSILALRTV